MDNWEIYYRTHARGVDKELTGSLPLSFVSNGRNLRDYRIYGSSGSVGDKTRNLWDEKNAVDTVYYINPSGNRATGAGGDRFLQNKIDIKALTKYTFTWAKNVLGSEGNTSYIRICEYTENDSFIGRILCDCSGQVDKNFTFTTSSSSAYLDVRIDSETALRGQHLVGAMLVLGSVPTAYEPYGYKIPVVCGGVTTNIYLDEPLGENESISMSDTGVSIPTINGTNILTVDTEVQPSKMYIKYGGSNNVNQSLMKYLEYKYKFAKE